MGRVSDVDLIPQPGKVVSERVVVTRKAILGKTLSAAGAGAIVWRDGDAGDSRGSSDELRRLTCVFDSAMSCRLWGKRRALGRRQHELGNSTKALSETQFIPLASGNQRWGSRWV